MFEGTITLGAVLTIAISLIGFLGAGVANAIMVGRYFGANDRRLEGIDKRMENLELEEKRMTEVLIGIAQQKTEIHLLSNRLDDVQKYGSHKLAEVLEAMRGQIMADFKERFDFLQKQYTS